MATQLLHQSPSRRSALTSMEPTTGGTAPGERDHDLDQEENGFSDSAILEVNQITGFFAWCNRIVDGLGVELEDFWAVDGVSNI